MSNDPRTPGRAAPVGAALAQHDLLRRLRALGLSAEAEPRVLRFLQRELEQALERANDQRWTAEEISDAGGDEALLEGLRDLRRDQRRAAALREAGLAELSPSELEAVLNAAQRS